VNPLKGLQKKLDHKNAIKHKNMRPPLDFLITPCTHSKEFENHLKSMCMMLPLRETELATKLIRTLVD